jgi:hypothetical protein
LGSGEGGREKETVVKEERERERGGEHVRAGRCARLFARTALSLSRARVKL